MSDICRELSWSTYLPVTGCHAIIYPGAFNLTTGPLHWELLQRARYVRAQGNYSRFIVLCFAGPSTTRSLYQCVVLLGTSPPDIMPSAFFPTPHRCHIKSVLTVVGSLNGHRSDVNLFPFIYQWESNPHCLSRRGSVVAEAAEDESILHADIGAVSFDLPNVFADMAFL